MVTKGITRPSSTKQPSSASRTPSPPVGKAKANGATAVDDTTCNVTADESTAPQSSKNPAASTSDGAAASAGAGAGAGAASPAVIPGSITTSEVDVVHNLAGNDAGNGASPDPTPRGKTSSSPQAISPLTDFDDLSVDTWKSRGTAGASSGTENSAMAALALFSGGNGQQQRATNGAGPEAASAANGPAPSPPKFAFAKFELDSADPVHITETECYLRATDHSTSPPVRCVLKLMTDRTAVQTELTARRGLDERYVLPVRSVHVDGPGRGDDLLDGYKGPIPVRTWKGMSAALGEFLAGRIAMRSSAPSLGPSHHHHHHHHRHARHQENNGGNGTDADASSPPPYPYALVLEPYDATLQSVLTHDYVDLNLVRKVVKDVVVGLILLHTERRVHGNLNPRAVVRVGQVWKLADLGQSRPIIGDSGGGASATGATTTTKAAIEQDQWGRRCNFGYVPPELATFLLGEGTAPPTSYDPDPTHDLFGLGCVAYHLVFGSSLWNVSKSGSISRSDLSALSAWSPLSFLTRASVRFPPERRTDDQRASLDLISKLLGPTPQDRRSAFEFGAVSVRQHEFLQGKPLDPTSLAKFRSQQDMMFRSEEEHRAYRDVVEALTLEERWELRRAKDVLLYGTFEPTHVHVPTSFVILRDRLPPRPAAGPDEIAPPMTKREAKKRLREGMKWVTSLDALDASVAGALNGDLTAVGHYWGQIGDMFSGDYMYLYWIDELTGMPVLPEEDGNGNGSGNGSSSDYPLEITTRSDTMPKILPLMHLTMRAMALYHGVAGIARMFGCTLPSLPEELRTIAQAKVNELKQERGSTPFGSLEGDADAARTCREQFLKGSSLRARSVREFVRFLERKEGRRVDFAGLRRYPDEDGVAVWTCVADAGGFRQAIAQRSAERLKEERNHWVDVQEEEIDALVRNIGEGTQKVTGLEKALSGKVEELARSNAASSSLASKVTKLEGALEAARREAAEARTELEEEKKRMKCGRRNCTIQ